MSVQREGLRWVKRSLKNWMKHFHPTRCKTYPKRSHKGQSVIDFENVNENALMWSLDKVKLVELIAGLDAMNAFGPGVTRKRLWDFFETSFSVKLTGAERALTQMKTRKIEPAKFSDELKCAVLDMISRSLE